MTDLTMTTRVLHSPGDIATLARFLDSRKLPLTVTIVSGKPRTQSQNRLQRLWLNEISAQLGDRTPEEVRGECKLTMGVPILRAENEEFRVAYDRVIRPLPYEAKLACMMEPLDLPVTRIMTKSQKVRYLDHMHRHFAGMGLFLTEPDADFAADLAKAREPA